MIKKIQGITASHFMSSEIAEDLLSELTATEILLIRMYFNAQGKCKKPKHTIPELSRAIDFISGTQKEVLEHYIMILERLNSAAKKKIDFSECFNNQDLLGPGLDPQTDVIFHDFRVPQKKHTKVIRQ